MNDIRDMKVRNFKIFIGVITVIVVVSLGVFGINLINEYRKEELIRSRINEYTMVDIINIIKESNSSSDNVKNMFNTHNKSFRLNLEKNIDKINKYNMLNEMRSVTKTMVSIYMLNDAAPAFKPVWVGMMKEAKAEIDRMNSIVDKMT